MKTLERGLHRVVGHRYELVCGHQSELALLTSANRFLGLVPRLIGGRLNLDQAGRRRAATTDKARGEDVAVGGDRRYPLAEGYHIRGGRRIRNKSNAIQQLLDRRPDTVWAGDHVSSPDRALAQSRPASHLDPVSYTHLRAHETGRK